jgi:hypothetical protein
MSGSLLRRSAALVIAFAGALVLGATTPTAAATPEHTEAKAAHAAAPSTTYRVTRESGNKCGDASFDYTYTARGDGFYDIKIAEGLFGWKSYLTTPCGTWGQPYAPVLQWQADTDTEGHFDWTVFVYGDNIMSLDDFEASGFKNVRFRVCNWNTNTDFIGTCGPS